MGCGESARIQITSDVVGGGGMKNNLLSSDQKQHYHCIALWQHGCMFPREFRKVTEGTVL